MTGRIDTQAALERLVSAAPLNVLTRPPSVAEPTASGPLDGMAVLVKANIAIGGMAWDGASPALSDVTAKADAGAVSRLRAAGASVIGHANCHELAFGITSANAHFGPVKNPRDPLRMAGGSSGGSAAAVAAGAVSAALGTDTGGSGRIPAAFCGCVGFRPTTGRYPADGVLTLSESFDTVTPFAATVADTAILDAVLAGDPTTVDPINFSDARIGILRDPFWRTASKAVTRSVDVALSQLKDAGATLVEIEADGTAIAEACRTVALPLVLAETERFWVPFLQAQLGLTIAEFVDKIASPDVSGVYRLIAEGKVPSVGELEELQQQRATVAEILSTIITEHDVLAIAHPACPIGAPMLTHTEEVDVDGTSHALFPLLTDERLVASITGMPALAVPAGRIDGALPFGVEFLGRRESDPVVLALGRAAETVWRTSQ